MKKNTDHQLEADRTMGVLKQVIPSLLKKDPRQAKIALILYYGLDQDIATTPRALPKGVIKAPLNVYWGKNRLSAEKLRAIFKRAYLGEYGKPISLSLGGWWHDIPVKPIFSGDKIVGLGWGSSGMMAWIDKKVTVYRAYKHPKQSEIKARQYFNNPIELGVIKPAL